MLSAWIARGNTDVDDIATQLATDGAVASLERALEQVDLPELPEPDEEVALATVTNLAAWVDSVNAGMT